MNLKRIQIMFNSHLAPRLININDHRLELVDNYIRIPRSKVTMNGDIISELLNRSKLGWRAFSKMNAIFRSNMLISLKRKIFEQYILPVPTCGCETWTLIARVLQKMKVTQRNMKRQTLNLSRRDKKRNA